MELKLNAFGIAKDILGAKTCKLQFEKEQVSLSEVRKILVDEYPDFAHLASLRFATLDEYREDSFVVGNGDEILLIPPVSGG
ncbi:MAG: MoaD/ThiS family protein [Flavobacteriales bacterium]|nr:MoaD/ThiS family protein [Flavobacteriales bacterium]